METSQESKWIIEDTKQNNSGVEGTNPNAVSHRQKEKKKAKRKVEDKLLEGQSNDNEQEPELTRKKKRVKVKKTKKIQVVQNTDGNKEKCIFYLKKWHEDRQNWKFEKLRQIWLFQNMLDPSKVPDSSFQILVDYMCGTRGRARQTIVERTMKVIKAMELWTELSEQGLKEEDIATQLPDGKVSEATYDRARSILQSLEDV